MMKTKNNTQFTIGKTTIILSTRLWLFTTLVALATASAAATNENTAYVDSVHQWGPWELDIEPAAGGRQAQTTQALNARDSKVRLRTNSMSALAPAPRSETRTRAPAPLPVTPLPTISGPVAPTTFAPPGGTTVTTFSPPPSPNIIPVNPTNTLPTGNGSLF